MKRIFRPFIVFVSFVLCFTSVWVVYAQNFAFLNNLKQGDSNTDVLELQKILNSDPKTQVATAGFGSPGSETSHFGPLTYQAVMKFQALYSQEILTPVDLIAPTGFVGPSTRAKLNFLISKNKVQNIDNSNTLNQPSGFIPQIQFTPGPRLLGLSRYQVAPGDKMTIFGSNFATTTTNNVYFDSSRFVSGVASPDQMKLEIDVPAGIPPGSYNIWVENKIGSSFESQYGNFFTVTNDPILPPAVYSVFPDTIELSKLGEITIYGSGFVSTDNKISIGFAFLENISSSDGKTIKVNLSDISEFTKLKSVPQLPETKNTILEIPITVSNKNGTSLTPVYYVFKFI
jgi:peptidoglycan hydrolase-like protein with peptidoglycan-binding domain